MLDLVSITANFVSITASARKQKKIENGIRELSTALIEVDPIYDLRRLAELIHSEFEEFSVLAMANTIKRLKGASSPIEFESAIADLIRHKQYKISGLKITAVKNSQYNETFDPLPLNVLKSIELLQFKVEECLKEQYTFDNLEIALNRCVTKRNYGEDLVKIIGRLDHAVKQIQLNANSIISGLSPVIEFIHFQIKQTLGDLDALSTNS